MPPDELRSDTEATSTAGHRSWGNYVSNVEFLTRTHLLDGSPRVIEIGCGIGELLRYVIDRGSDAVGIDISPRCDPDLPVIVADGENLPFADRTFNLALSFDVLEHIPDTDRHLNEVGRVLKAGGRYAFQTPNVLTNVPFEVLRAAKQGGIHAIPYAFRPPEHCSLHSYWRLLRRLRRHGFVVTFIDVPVVNEYFVSKLETYAGRLGTWALRTINPDKMPLPFRTNFYVVAQSGG